MGLLCLSIFFNLGLMVVARRSLDEPMGLKLIRHEACKWKEGAKWDNLIVFPNSSIAQLEEDTEKGCYKIGGNVLVAEDVGGMFQIHVELRYDAESSEQCYDQKPNGCGGFGSCLYCDACALNTGKDGAARKDISNGGQRGKVLKPRTQIYENGQAVDCRRGLKKGIHKDMYLHFCLPSKRSFLKNQGFDEETWNRLFDEKYNTALHNKFGIFMVLRIYNTKVNTLMAKDHKKAMAYRREHNLEDDDPIPEDLMRDWPFHRLLKSNENFISCHKVFGNIID